MAKCPHARWKPIPENDSQPRIVPVGVVDHSAGGAAELYGWWMNDQSKGLESHFWIDDDEDPDGYATVYQYIDTEVRADANGEGNRWLEGGKYVGLISIETSSTTHASEPWTPSQIKSLIRLHIWLIETHPTIPPVEMPKSSRNSDWHGQAWHIKQGTPGSWTRAAGKVCPGGERIRQCREDVYPAVAAHFNKTAIREGLFMYLTKAEEQEILRRVRSIDKDDNYNRGALKAIGHKVFGRFKSFDDTAKLHTPK